jgi:malate dehydrogenase (oxaloacetate-decarboxylating)
VIDLRDTTTTRGGWIPGDHQTSVISPDDPGYRLLPAPGLCVALVRHPDASLDLDVFRACALALAAATPPGHLVPDLDDRHLTHAIASPVLRVLARRPPSRSPRPPRRPT